MAEFLFSELEAEQESKRTVKSLEARRHAPATAPHVATPEKRGTDRERILRLLSESEYVELETLLKACPSGYTKRISELRQKGWKIECVKHGNTNRYFLRGKK